MIFNRKFFREAAILVGLSVAVRLVVNIPLIRRCLKGELNQGFISTKTYPGVVLITLAEAEDLFAGEKAFSWTRARKRNSGKVSSPGR